MARQNRRDIFDPNEVGCYHAVQRTVRRAWLCGSDPVSGKSFEHRRIWIQNRLQELAASFGIDCLSFAVMVNHSHVILRNRPDIVATVLPLQATLFRILINENWAFPFRPDMKKARFPPYTN